MESRLGKQFLMSDNRMLVTLLRMSKCITFKDTLKSYKIL